MTENTDTFSHLDDDAKLGWKAAGELIRPFGPVAANFSEAIRLLVAAHYSDDPQASLAGQNHVVRLIKNETIKATYYFFSKQFKPDLLSGKRPVTEKDFFQAFSPIDHAAILTFCYLFKTLGKKIEGDEWDYVQTPLYEALAIGGRVGQSIKDIGLGLGLLARGVRYLAFATFMRENRKAFKEYRQHLKAKDIPFDTAFEENLWQCSSIQIAGLLLERMGYPRAVGLQLVAACERSSATSADMKFGVPFRMAECLIDAYMEGHEIPTTTPAWVGKEIDLPAEVRGTLLAALNQVLDQTDRIEWLSKSSADISESNTPELFVGN
jgi:hypothetical protein